MVTDVSFGGTVVGKVGISDTRVAAPMPALSQVVTGEIVPTCAWAAGANRAATATLTAARLNVQPSELKTDVLDVPVFECIIASSGSDLELTASYFRQLLRSLL